MTQFYMHLYILEEEKFYRITETHECVHLISGSLWSLINLSVTSQACLKRPSVPMGPMACTIFWVRRKGTTSGTSNVSP